METQELGGGRSLARRLADFIDRLGLPLWGVASGEGLRQYQGWYDRRPAETVSPFETGAMAEKCDLSGNFIALAFPYAHELVWPADAHFSVYVRGRDYHQVVQGYLEAIAGFIRDLGHQAEIHVDSTELPERLIAASAGLGWIGRNGMLITEAFGSYVFLGEIRTDMPLPTATGTIAPDDRSRCGDCRRCVAACPVQILGADYVQTRRCLSSLTQQKTPDRSELQLLGGRLFGCDTCQRVCPFNEGRDHTGLADFRPLEYMVHPDLDELIRLSKGRFRDRYAITSAGWRGKSVLAVNALAALHRLGRLPDDLTAGSPLVQAAYDKLKEQIPTGS